MLHVPDVEQGELESAEPPGPRGVRGSKTEEMRLIDRVQVRRHPGDLQEPQYLRGPRVGDVEDEQGIDPAERDEVCSLSEEPGAEEPLPGREARDAPERVQEVVEDEHGG